MPIETPKLDLQKTGCALFLELVVTRLSVGSKGMYAMSQCALLEVLAQIAAHDLFSQRGFRSARNPDLDVPQALLAARAASAVRW